MQFKKIIIVVVLLISSLVFGQLNLKVGNNPTSINSCAVLELESTTKGLLLPRLSNTAICHLLKKLDTFLNPKQKWKH
jgi:hypothetical protein